MPDDEKKEKQNRPGSTSLLTKYRKHRDAVKKIAAIQSGMLSGFFFDHERRNEK